MQSRGENSEAPWQKGKKRALRVKRVGNFQGLEVNFGKLLLVYLMRPPDLEALGVMRPLGP